MRKVICVIAVMGLTVAWAAPAQAATHDIERCAKASGAGDGPALGAAGNRHLFDADGGAAQEDRESRSPG